MSELKCLSLLSVLVFAPLTTRAELFYMDRDTFINRYRAMLIPFAAEKLSGQIESSPTDKVVQDIWKAPSYFEKYNVKLFDPSDAKRYRHAVDENFTVASKRYSEGQSGPYLITIGMIHLALEPMLFSMTDSPRYLNFPASRTQSAPQFRGIVPGHKFRNVNPINVCLELGGRVLGTWEVNSLGQVREISGTWDKVAESPTSSACPSFLRFVSSGISK